MKASPLLTELAHEAQLRAWLASDDWRMACLQAAAALDPPECWVGAGFLRNLVWDRLHGFAQPTPLADVDVLTFEPASGTEREAEIEATLASDLPAVPWSVKNQARMHVRNGDAPYRDTVLTPFGLTDLFALTVRPTPHARSRRDRLKEYRLRMAQKAWPAIWPNVRVYAF
jgi:hypothetical protein